MGEVFGTTPNTSHLIVGRLADAEAFTTLDGSQIRELAGAVSLATCNQSLAEATVPPGGATEAHYHRTSEEIYFFTAGAGRMKRRRGVRRERGRLRGDPARGRAQALEHRRRAARAAVLLRARVLA